MQRLRIHHLNNLMSTLYIDQFMQKNDNYYIDCKNVIYLTILFKIETVQSLVFYLLSLLIIGIKR